MIIGIIESGQLTLSGEMLNVLERKVNLKIIYVLELVTQVRHIPIGSMAAFCNIYSKKGMLSDVDGYNFDDNLTGALDEIYRIGIRSDQIASDFGCISR